MSVGANLPDHDTMPSVEGAGNSTSVQYRAVVPSQGTSPRCPLPTGVPVASRNSTVVPANTQPLELFAPTVIEWGSYPEDVQRLLLLLSCEDATSGTMPGPYTLVRPDTTLSPQDIDTICAAARDAEAKATHTQQQR